MKVTATRTVYVAAESGEKLLNKGESADVDGRTYSNKHPFIRAGYLVPDKAASTDTQADSEASGADDHRQDLMDAIEQATGKRPGVKAKTETLEKRWAEIQAAQEASGSGEGDQAQDEPQPEE